MWVGRTRHCDGPVFVLEAVAGLVLDGPLGWLLAHVGLETAALDHEAVDDAVKDRAVIEPALRVLQKIRYRLGGLVGVELEREGARPPGSSTGASSRCSTDCSSGTPDRNLRARGLPCPDRGAC